MKIYLHEITDQETELDFTQEDPWVVTSVLRVDEHTDELKRGSEKRPIRAHLSLRKVDEVIVVSGDIDTHIELVCSRCANTFKHACQPQFSALFCKDPVMAGVAHLHRQGTDRKAPGKPMGQNQGFARHAHNSEEDEAGSEGKDLDITYLSNDYIDLADVISEQLQFQVPFQPLCKETCKGICSLCGTDLNLGRCACAKIQKSHPFSVLKDFKL
jgi:uncharacterized protein